MRGAILFLEWARGENSRGGLQRRRQAEWEASVVRGITVTASNTELSVG